jgi:hypothetical protein
MILDVAALLQAIQQKEMEVIARSGITHAPTIGTQYEGLTSSLLGLMIPEELQLRVVTAFVEGVASRTHMTSSRVSWTSFGDMQKCWPRRMA